MAYSLKYSFNSSTNSYSVTGYENITLNDIVIIPDTYNDGTNGEHSVTNIGDYAFSDCSNLTSIKIPNSVTSIGFSSFRGCSSLTSVIIPDSVTSIGAQAFRSCSSSTSVTIGNSVTSIDSWAFSNCRRLTSITIPDSVTGIGFSAFADCSSLKQIILFPPQPPTLGSNAIPNNVQSIYVLRESNEAYKSATNWTALSSKIVSDNLYLSFARFNAKNKEYIDNGLNKKLTTPATPTSESAIVLGADGNVSTKALTSITGKTEVAVQGAAPTSDEILWINPDGTSGGGSSGGKLYRHNITLVNNTVRGSQTFQQDKIVYQINITLLDRNGDEINNVDKLIARFDNYIYRSVVFFGVYNYNQSIGGSYNVRINNLESTSKIVALNGSSIGNFNNHVDPIGISTGNGYGWILKIFSGSTYTADDITYADAVTEV